ncbi:MAG: hypothetical protein DHS20C06_06740 [Hyphobacterium sp.]|nr:MAG: hypothetical protein DHS20C06_06740 [Hyphobacterium sp.]
MPGWIQALNFVSARLRRGVFILLILAALQAMPSGVGDSGVAEPVYDYSHTLRRTID